MIDLAQVGAFVMIFVAVYGLLRSGQVLWDMYRKGVYHE